MPTSNVDVDIENPSIQVESSGTGKKIGIALLVLLAILAIVVLILWQTNTWPFNTELTYSCSGSSCIEDEKGIYSASNCSNNCVKEPDCIINSNCDEGYLCINNECVIDDNGGGGGDEGECTNNSDCNEGYLCLNNECIIDDNGGGGENDGGCTNNSDCNEGYLCMNNECVIDDNDGGDENNGGCINNSDCNEGYLCLNNECVIDDNNGGGGDEGGCTNNSDCNEGYLCLNNDCVIDDNNGGGGNNGDNGKKYNCNIGNCIADEMGEYDSLEECQNVCSELIITDTDGTYYKDVPNKGSSGGQCWKDFIYGISGGTTHNDGPAATCKGALPYKYVKSVGNNIGCCNNSDEACIVCSNYPNEVWDKYYKPIDEIINNGLPADQYEGAREVEGPYYKDAPDSAKRDSGRIWRDFIGPTVGGDGWKTNNQTPISSCKNPAYKYPFIFSKDGCNSEMCIKCSNLPDDRFPYTDRVGEDGVIRPLYVENGVLTEGFTLNMNNNELINGLDGEFYKMVNQKTYNYNK